MRLNQCIRQCVEAMGDPLMEDFIQYVGLKGFYVVDIKEEVKAMVQRGELRMKEDCVDHDWTYRRGRNW